MTALRYDFTGLLSDEENLYSPAIPAGGTGLWLAADRLKRGAEHIRFVLRIAYCLTNDVHGSFRRVPHGMVVVLRDQAARDAVAFRLIDPGVNPLVEDDRPNFTDRRTDPPSLIRCPGYVNVPLELRLPTEGHPGLWAHITLLDQQSNVVRIAVDPDEPIDDEDKNPAETEGPA